MKTTLAAILISALSFTAHAGGMVGNGGDAVLQEFNLRGIQLANYFKSELSVAQTYGIDPLKFLATVKGTKLEGQDHLFLSGQEVDAINYPPESRIEVSRTRWTQSATRGDAYFVQRRIALHEYLWVYGINDAAYTVSNAILADIEKSVGPLVDPDVRKLLMRKFCNKIDAADYAGARGYLSWGLDLNEDCAFSIPSTPSIPSVAPMQIVLNSYLAEPAEQPSESDRISLIQAMLQFGSNPNQMGFSMYPLLVDSMTLDLNFTRLLFDFGADPNLMDEKNGITAFTYAARIGSGSTPRAMNAESLMMFLNAGGDVNLSGDRLHQTPAREIVAKGFNAEVAEVLIKSGKTDWCSILDGAMEDRTIDMVSAEYRPLLATYHIQCPPYAKIFGKGATCQAAQDDGRRHCTDLGFKNASLDPLSETEICLKADTFLVKFHCTN
jgi:hypothetical protein